MRPVAATYRFMNGPLRAPPCATLTLGADCRRRDPAGAPENAPEDPPGTYESKSVVADAMRPVSAMYRFMNGPPSWPARPPTPDCAPKPSITEFRRLLALCDAPQPSLMSQRGGSRGRGPPICATARAGHASASLERAPARVRAHRSPGARAWLQSRRMAHRLRVYSPLDPRAEALWPRGEREGLPATADPQERP